MTETDIHKRKDGYMYNTRFTRCLTMLVLVVAMLVSMAIPAYAADFKFSYIDWDKTEKDFSVYQGASNRKAINGQEATVKGTSVECDPNTNGWGFRVVYRGDGSNNPVSIKPDGFADVTKRTFWLNGNYTIHPQYRDNYGGKDTEHYVAARLDDESRDGKYNFTGYFNSDYT